MSEASAIQKVVVIGASGNLGKIILPALWSAKSFQITVLTRTPNKNPFPSDVNVVETTYSESELVDIFRGHDAVISTVGATGFTEQKCFVDAAVKAGIKRFIPSELSANTLSDAVRELVPVFEPKKQLLDYLKEKEITGLTWTGLASGPLLDWGLTTGFLGFDIEKNHAVIWDEGKAIFSATNQADVGKAVVSILQHPNETANRYLYVQTTATSQNEILKSLERMTGKKWTVDRVQTEEQVAKGRHLVSQGDFTGMFELVKASVWGNVSGIRSNYAVEEQLANSLLGLQDESLDETVRAVTAN